MTLGTKFKKVKINWSIHLVDLIVVIIGVTVAFGIGNWAEKQKHKREIKVILNTMANEIKQDIDIYNRHQIPTNTKIAESIQSLIDVVYADELNEDSLIYHIKGDALSSFNWHISRSTFESLIQSGKMDIIDNYSLKLLIRNVYEASYGQSKFIMELNLETTKDLKELINEKLDLQDESTYKEIVNNRKFRNLLGVSKKLTLAKVNEYKQSVTVLSELLEAIKLELGSNYESDELVDD